MSALPSTIRIAPADSSSPARQSPEGVIASLQEEILKLHDEIADLRRRDETLNYHLQHLDEELRLAARLQRDFLPKTLPQVGRLRFDVLFRPAGYVSGDIYDVVRLDETHVGFYIADAVGHGIPAALLTMFVKRALVTKEILTKGYRLLPPSESLAQLNQALVEQGFVHTTFATAVYGVIDAQTLQCTFARGGHPLPILLSADGQIRALSAEGGLLGIFADDTFADASVQMRPGDRLIIHSDGVEVCFSDRANADPAEWQRQLLMLHSLSTSDLLAALSEQVDKNTGSLTPKDDLTIVVAEIQ